MKQTTDAYPRLYRYLDHSILGGVCTGIALYFGVNVAIIRILFVAFSVLSSFGLVAYILLWIFVQRRDERVTVPDFLPGWVSYILLVPTVLSIFSVGNFSTSMVLIGAVIFEGIILSWFAFDRYESKRSTAIIVLGSVMVLGGILAAAWQWENFSHFGGAVGAVLLTLAGVAAVLVPFLMRMWQNFLAQREEKLIADERAELAARLHDSVLQTLVVIQKNAHDPDEVIRLARGQERELRGWLFGTPSGTETVFAALRRACGEVEDTCNVRIAQVLVGDDYTLDERSQACILAAREAMMNAAKHTGGSDIDVYAETFNGLDIYVRDRGPGFDITTIDPSRHGVRESIIGRVERAGGTVVITSNMDATAGNLGTEVEIHLPSETE